MDKITIIIPAYNAENTIGNVSTVYYAKATMI